MEVGTIIKLKACDNTIVEVSSHAAKRSKFICDLFADFKDTEITIAEADGPTLKDIVEYLEHYKEEEPKAIRKPIDETERLPDLVDKWDVDFAERTTDLKRLENLIVAADYMGIDPLHELMVAKWACMMLDLGTAEAICKTFNIEEDITEEEQIKMEQEMIAEHRKQKKEEEEKKKLDEEKEKEKVNEKIEGEDKVI